MRAKLGRVPGLDGMDADMLHAMLRAISGWQYLVRACVLDIFRAHGRKREKFIFRSPLKSNRILRNIERFICCQYWARRLRD